MIQIVDVAGVKVGGDNLALIAGPCSVESEEQVIEIAKAAKAAGANILRGGAFKPRTSPYAFQGMGSSGLDILVAAKEATGLPICSELMDAQYLEEFNEKVDLDSDRGKKYAKLRPVKESREQQQRNQSY